jgi:hypothetical protein
MAINYTYPAKGSPVGADRFLIVDSADSESTKLVTITSALSAGVPWGTITGTLSTQTDLQSALDLKENLAGAKYITPTAITVSAGDTVDLGDTEYVNSFMIVLTWEGATGNMTLTLPPVADNVNRTIRIITDSTFDNGGQHIANITPASEENLDGSTDPFAVNRGYEGIKAWSNGTEWFIIQQKA